MNLEQIVKETVAKFVAEKQGKDLTGDGKIDSADYLQARSNAIEKAKGLDEDYEVAMAQDSLDSIIRAAMMLKTQMGDKEINLPAWIQDHITNSENYIYQAAKGYHESDAQMDDKAGAEEMDEEAFKPKSSFDDYSVGDTAMLNGKKVEIIAMEMDDETGERRAEVKYEDNTIEKEVSINSLDESQLEEDMGGVRQNLGQEVVQKYGYQLKPIFDKYKESNIEWSQILKQYGSNSPEFKEVNDINKKLSSGFKNAALNGAAIMLKAKGASDTQIRNYFSEYGYFEDWVSDFMDELMDELDALAAKATNKSLDEATVRRWQHYAGIK